MFMLTGSKIQTVVIDKRKQSLELNRALKDLLACGSLLDYEICFACWDAQLEGEEKVEFRAQYSIQIEMLDILLDHFEIIKPRGLFD